MHSRLLPLTPPLPNFANRAPRFALPRISLPSMPWMEIGLFGLMIFGVMSLGG